MAEKEQQVIDKHSFYVKGKVDYVAKKIATLYSGPSYGGTGKATEIDLSLIPKTGLKSLGVERSEIEQAYSVNVFHRNDFMSGLMIILGGQAENLRAVVIEYKAKPGVSEVIPYLKNSEVKKTNMKKLRLELI